MDLFGLTGIFLVGAAIVVPVIYLLSWLSGSIFWGTFIAVIVLVLAAAKIKWKKIRLDTSSVLLLLGSFVFSTWIMFKTFHGGSGGEIFVGSNNVFDFGHALGIIRSMSWGTNIPLRSPFFAGLPFFYNFFFNFWVAVLEYFRIPIVWAMNVPSILSFTALLVVIYYLPQIIAKQKPLVGWVAVLFTITNSSLTFWKLLAQKADILHLPTYPFAGPFDGSTISIFVTLNNYTNQRHLAFASALGLFLFIIVSKWATDRKITLTKMALLGLVTGFLLFWNMVVYALVVALCLLVLVLHERWKPGLAYVCVSCLVGILWMLPYIGYASHIVPFLQQLTAGALPKPTQWSLVDYLWQNLGLLPVVAALGVIVLTKSPRKIFGLFVIFFIVECVASGIGHRGFEQKTFSFLITGINALAAIGVGWIWKKMKVAAVLLVFVLTISGFVDLIPIKNEFAFPLIGRDTAPVIAWIHSSTPKDAVFVSYSDIVDPVVLAGRRNYFGFFGNIGSMDRTPIVLQVYRGDAAVAKANHISYILVPKWQKNDFPYVVDERTLRSIYPVAFEDDRVLILRTGLSL
jgi:hypothetical protein